MVVVVVVVFICFYFSVPLFRFQEYSTPTVRSPMHLLDYLLALLQRASYFASLALLLSLAIASYSREWHVGKHPDYEHRRGAFRHPWGE